MDPNVQNSLRPSKNNARVLGYAVIIVLIIIVAGFAGWKFYNGKKSQKPLQEANNQPLASFTPQTASGSPDLILDNPVIKQIDKSIIPSLIPKDFPLEQGAEVVDNYSSQSNAALTNVRSFYSKGSVQENFDLYKKAFEDQKWPISSVTGNANEKAIKSEAGDGNVTVIISKSAPTGKSLVQISITMNYIIKK